MTASEDIIRIFPLFLIALLIFVTAGCGGSSSAVTNRAGIYRSQFTRGTGIPSLIVATVKVDGTADVVISDSSGLAFSGTAIPTGANTLAGALTGPGGSLEFQGEFVTPGRVFGGDDQDYGELAVVLFNAGGAVAQVLATAMAANNNSNFGGSTPFTGPLAMTTADGEIESASLTVGADGRISGTVNSPSAGSFSVTGSVNALAVASFHGTGSISDIPVEFTYSGTLYQKPTATVDVAGKGTFTLAGSFAGTWTAD